MEGIPNNFLEFFCSYVEQIHSYLVVQMSHLISIGHKHNKYRSYLVTHPSGGALPTIFIYSFVHMYDHNFIQNMSFKSHILSPLVTSTTNVNHNRSLVQVEGTSNQKNCILLFICRTNLFITCSSNSTSRLHWTQARQI